jgi:DNA-binding transcriptional regulator LsrR (DeoR family)
MRDERGHIETLLQVARMYYLDDLSQEEIADRVAFSRSTVSRMLEEARTRHIVRFSIGHPMEREADLERRIVERFGLEDVHVASPAAGVDAGLAVAMTGARLVIAVCKRATILAVSEGLTIASVVEQLAPCAFRDLVVVQMLGALSVGNPTADGPSVVRRTSEKLGGTYRLLPAPLLVGSRGLARALRKEESVATALALASHADVALIGIGGVDAPGMSGRIFQSWLTEAERAHVHHLGAVGHISGHHFDAQGRHIVTPFCDRVMAVDLDQIHSVSTVICVAYGPAKVAGIRGALRGGLLDILVTDARTAAAVLAE